MRLLRMCPMWSNHSVISQNAHPGSIFLSSTNYGQIYYSTEGTFGTPNGHMHSVAYTEMHNLRDFLQIVGKVFEFYSSFYEDAPFGPNHRNLLLGKTKNAFSSFVIPNMFPKFQDERLRTFEISDLQKKETRKKRF